LTQNSQSQSQEIKPNVRTACENASAGNAIEKDAVKTETATSGTLARCRIFALY
jgi:hypothetical protein